MQQGVRWKYTLLSLSIFWRGTGKPNYPTIDVSVMFYGQVGPDTLPETEKGIEQKIKSALGDPKGYEFDYINFTPEPVDCFEVYESVENKTWIQDGVYWIKAGEYIIDVYCDMQNQGWTFIQRHLDNSESFALEMSSYISGFGLRTTNHWIGLDVMSAMTKTKQYQLRIDLQDCKDSNQYILYEKFAVLAKSQNYALQLELPKDKTHIRNPPGDSLYNPMYFVTGDSSSAPANDIFAQTGNSFTVDGKNGGWWFSDISKNRFNLANLNGKIAEDCKGDWPNGMFWNVWHGATVSLKSATMKIIPTQSD